MNVNSSPCIPPGGMVDGLFDPFCVAGSRGDVLNAPRCVAFTQVPLDLIPFEL